MYLHKIWNNQLARLFHIKKMKRYGSFSSVIHPSGHHNNSSAFNFEMNGFCQF
jgi:hypothetical protein